MAVPGWWSGLDRFVPEFDQPGQLLGHPALGLLAELALGTFAVAAALLFGHPTRRLRLVRTAAGTVAVVAALVVWLAGPELPPAPVSLSGAAVGAPVVSGTAAVATPPVVLQGVQPGRYRVTLRYSLTGAAPTGSLVLGVRPHRGRPPARTVAALAAGTRTSVVGIRCPTVGPLQYRLQVGPRSVLRVDGAELAKVSF